MNAIGRLDQHCRLSILTAGKITQDDYEHTGKRFDLAKILEFLRGNASEALRIRTLATNRKGRILMQGDDGDVDLVSRNRQAQVHRCVRDAVRNYIN